MENSGKIKIGNKEYNVFLQEIGTVAQEPNIPPVVIPDVPVSNSGNVSFNGVRFDAGRNEYVIGVKIGNAIPSEISWNGNAFYSFSVLFQKANTTNSYWFKSNDKITKVEIKIGNSVSDISINGVNFNETGSTVDTNSTNTTPPVVVPPITIPNTNNPQRPLGNPLTGFAEIGKEYHVFQKTRLHLSSYVAGDKAQYYSVKKDGVILFTMNTIDGEVQDPKEITMGNHHVASILPIDEGDIEMYFENTSKEGAQVVGLIKRHMMAYEQYNKDGLQFAEAWKRLEEGQSWSHTFNIKHNRGDLIKDGKFEVFFPVFKNGKLLINKQIMFNGSQYGLGNTFIDPYSVYTVRASVMYEPSLYIEVEVKTAGLSDYPIIKVISKNGLDVHPKHVIVDAFSREYEKVFNNHASGYKSQPEHPENRV